MGKEIVVRISPDGKDVTIDQVGFHGSSCDAECKNLFDALGSVKTQKKKAEYYAKKKQDTHIKNKTGG